MNGLETDRDLDLVSVTGAGASRSFGVEGPFPLMADWAAALVTRLRDKPMQSTEAQRGVLPLRDDMTGPEFETTLGLFLGQVRAFDDVKALLKPSLEIFGISPNLNMTAGGGGSELALWYDQTKALLDELLEVLNESLYEQFAGRVDAIRVRPGSPILVATTNYDIIAQTALSALGFLVDWGRPPQLLNTSSEEPLRVERLLGGLPRYLPVLHLHGKVGWYSRPNGEVWDYVNTNYSRQWGTPVVMWPDDRKDAAAYGAQLVINELWDHFRNALRRARKVLVIGHSLNDSFLVQAIRHNVPPERLAVTSLSTPPSRNSEHRVAFNLGAKVLPISFGPKPSGVDELANWSGTIDDRDAT